MRVAVIAQQASAGGGTRFLRPLVRALAETFSDIEITLFINAQSAEVFGAGSGFGHPRVKVVPIDPIVSAHPASDLVGHAPVSGRRTLLEATGIRDRRPPMLRAVSDLARAVRGFDVVYLAWPFFLHPMILEPPVVGTFHDFNYKHDFGSLGPEFVSLLDVQIGYWLDRCEVPVTSADFIAGEVARFYPEAAPRVRVVHLATLLADDSEVADAAAVAARHGIEGPYVICPSNTSRHKNLARLLRAYGRVRADGGPPLVLMGSGTQLLNGITEEQKADPTAAMLAEALEESGLRVGEDLFALGYVSDADADALIAGATLLVAPSLYEAGSGPGLDAWALGTPVVMSAIPAFVEHISFLGVEAQTFDPLDVEDMVRAIAQVLADPDGSRAAATRSRTAIARYTGADVAAGYRAAFEAAIDAHGRRRP
jgi:glycosyltransferase involved in cell wall biosynthesis